MIKYSFMLLITFLCNAKIGFAQTGDSTLNSTEDTEHLSVVVTKLFEQNKISEAMNELRPFWPLPANEIDGLEEKTIKYLNLLKDRFGEPFGFEKVNHEIINEFAVRETYIVKYDLTGIRLIFTYYKNKEGWILNAFKWDDSYTEEFRAVEFKQ